MKSISTREKRLWAAVGLIVFIIYFTLGLVVETLQSFQASGWGKPVFWAGCVIALVSVVTKGGSVVPNRNEILIAIGIAILYSVVLSNIEHSEERIHVIMYGVVALLIYAALLERSGNSRRFSKASIVVIVITTAIGAIDEMLQWGMPNRVFDVYDILYDTLASVMAVISNGSLRWIRGQSV